MGVEIVSMDRAWRIGRSRFNICFVDESGSFEKATVGVLNINN
jgi:hypothetical protein